jgi:hypothetical protein
MARYPRAHPLRYWPGVRGRGTAEVAGECRDRDVSHRAGQSLGERLLRELQRKAAGRVFEWGDLLVAEGGADRDREVAGGIQHKAATLGAGLQAAGAGDLQPPGSTKLNFAALGCDIRLSHLPCYKNSGRSVGSTLPGGTNSTQSIARLSAPVELWQLRGVVRKPALSRMCHQNTTVFTSEQTSVVASPKMLARG